jgi:hypothetical protein
MKANNSFLLLAVLMVIVVCQDDGIPNDLNTSIREMVEREGFAFEKHQLVTKDGYILVLHRIKVDAGKSVLM